MAVNVVLKSVWDDRGIKDAEKAFSNFGKKIDGAFKAVAVASAAATAAFIRLGSDSIKEASTLEESINAVNVAFGEAAAGVLKIGETSAESLGVARSEFNQAAVRFSAFAERVVGQGGDVAGFIRDISTRATDFASVFNIDVAEALRVFQSGLSGEAEPLKRFGINLLDSEVKAYALRAGIISVGESMTETQKVQARFGLLMEATAKTAGDFANTSDSLANKQRILQATFTDLQAEIGNALLPAVSDLFSTLADQLLPIFEDLGDFLASPEGKQVIAETAQTIENLVTFIAENLGTIVDFAIKIAAAVTALKVLKTALEVATVAQGLFNLVVKANPYVLAATAIATLIGGIFAFANAIDQANEASGKNIKTTEDIEEEIRRLNEAYEDGLIPQDKYEQKLASLEENLQAARLAALGLNTVDLSAFRTQLGDTRVDAERLVDAQRELYYAMRGLTPPSRPTRTTNTTSTTTTRTSSANRESEAQKAARQQREGIEKARKIIADAAKELEELQTENTKELARINADYLDAVAKTNTDFANRLADIVQQSQNRLRDAYRNAVAVNISEIFGTRTTQKITTEIKKIVGNIQTTISRETEETVGGSVDDLVAGLRNKLESSRQLLANSASLASRGFSQTFIEQVVGAGVETGNELAKAILEATPETQRELKDLFKAVETESETGMDKLAKSIFDKAGLATRELKNLYAATVAEQAEALKDLKDQLDKDLLETNTKFSDAVSKLREKFQEDIAAIKTDISSLKSEIDALIAKMAELAGIKMTAPTIPQTAAPTIPSVPKPTPPKAGTTINVNVKTDPTKSAAETGRQVAKVVNKYTGTGGALKIGAGAI